MTKLVPVPLTIKKANEIVRDFHRHNEPVHIAKFAIGAECDGELVGVCIVGRPVSRVLDDDYTVEVRRCCVFDDSPKGTCSFLYAAAWRAWRAMGGRKIITYTLQSESGSSLRGAGWSVVHKTSKRNDIGWGNRDNRQMQNVSREPKFRWEMV